MRTAPLLLDFARDAPIGWREGEPIACERFVGSALALAQVLPRDGHCVNLCEDRLNFMLGFAAALIARSTSLLPQSRAPAFLEDLAGHYPHAVCLTDRPETSTATFTRVDIAAWPACSITMAVPQIDLDQQAAILFTSGSTGEPRPHAKRWRSLIAASAAVRAALPLTAGSTLLGVVPAQHMWGFEMTVMLPLQAGCAIAADCPLLPAEIGASLARLPGPRWVVATPLHFRACVAEARLPEVAGLLSATAALPVELARDVEHRFAAPLFEIYGSTETGTLAMRRPAQTDLFRTLGDIRLRADTETTIATGGHLDHAVALADVLELNSETCFLLHGRSSDLIKIGGKRGSLSALNFELGRVPGVLDGVFCLREGARGEPRLMAFAVAPSLTARDIAHRLRRRLDVAFMPRPLIVVAALPRNPAGKLTQGGLQALAAAHGLQCAAPIPGSGRWHEVSVEHPALPFHFPGDPLVPGVWLLALVERAAREQFGSRLVVQGIPDATFRRVLRPAQRFRIAFDRTAVDRVTFKVESADARIADGTLVVADSQ